MPTRRQLLLGLPTLAAPRLAGAAGAAGVLRPRFGYGLADDSNQGRAARLFAEEVMRRTDGRIMVEVIGNAIFGTDAKLQAAAAEGKIEFSVTSTATLVEWIPEFSLLDAPFLFSNPAEADAVLDGPVGDQLRAKLRPRGLVGLVYWENGFRNLTTSVRPVRRLEDFQGLRIRVMQNPVALETFERLGTQARPLAFDKLYDALRDKEFDAQENPLANILQSRLYEVQKYLTLTRHVYSAWIVIASARWWDALPPADQKAIMEAAVVSRDFERADTRMRSAQALKDLKAAGLEINELSFSEANRISNRLNRVYAHIGPRVGLPLLVQTQAQLAEMRERHR
ncbi:MULTISPECIES: DctP family TRAP transporter solute-binding subunit [Ramlibacter]|uniref:DctP family TRAP transporter solute-binding subunit n=1 Tax=Ramlibacter aquaticus TaxID=2780094 RepID=A0ABR9SA79_9BURK|nr:MULTISPECIES: DctP family TRAP transporter solute-binding subunit [Ramlibacter]MBE7938992.1 DctP family TRAP transporter solute-binding subunit [Ramlibacter aquaticus]